MSIALQCLLRLPAGLRRHALLNTIPPKSIPSTLDAKARRTFSNSKTTLIQQRPTRTAPRPIAAKPPPPTQRPSSSPKPTPTPSLAKPRSPAEQLLNTADEVLLYKAPSHTSYTLTSYLLGSALLGGAVLFATLPTNIDLTGWKRYMVRISNSATIFFMTAMGTALILAPMKMVGKLSVVRGWSAGSGAGTALRCEMKPSLPWAKGRVFDVKPAEAMLDRYVSAVEIDVTSIPMSKAQDFTASAVTEPEAKWPPSYYQRNLIGRAWATFSRDVRRVFYREGIAYIRFEGRGNWKLDLQHCELLDNGRPLERLTSFDAQRGLGPIAWLRRKGILG